MKLLCFCYIIFLPFSALASSCDNPDSTRAAQTALLNAYDGTDPSDVQISNVETRFYQGQLVCLGEVTTPKFTTNALWSVTQTPMGWDASVIQAVDPQHFVENNTPQSDQQGPVANNDQEVANQIAADDAHLKVECAQIKAHPIQYAMKVGVHKSLMMRHYCAMLPSMEAQAAQMEAQEGIAPDASKAANQ